MRTPDWKPYRMLYLVRARVGVRVSVRVSVRGKVGLGWG